MIELAAQNEMTQDKIRVTQSQEQELITFSKDRFEESAYKKGQLVYNEGNKPLGVYYILSGKMKNIKLGSSGKEQVLKIGVPGEFFGYQDLIYNEKHSSSAICIEDAKFLFIDKEEFQNLLASNQELSFLFLKLLSKELIDTESKMIDIAYKPVRGRLADALLNLNSKKINPISLSRDELAHFVGTATETIIRLLSDFKKEKIITSSGRDIRIINLEKLAKVSEFYE